MYQNYAELSDEDVEMGEEGEDEDDDQYDEA
jgi:hypothetical protein